MSEYSKEEVVEEINSRLSSYYLGSIVTPELMEDIRLYTRTVLQDRCVEDTSVCVRYDSSDNTLAIDTPGLDYLFVLETSGWKEATYA